MRWVGVGYYCLNVSGIIICFGYWYCGGNCLFIVIDVKRVFEGDNRINVIVFLESNYGVNCLFFI